MSAAGTIDRLDEERARLFALLARLLSAAPDAALLHSLATLRGDTSPLGRAYATLAEAAGATTAEAVAREFFTLFTGVGRGDILPYASYYLTGFLHERPLADLRATLARLGIRRAPGIPEPEDHIAFIAEVFGGLIEGRFPGDADAFFARHMKPWAGRLFADLQAAESARFYRAVGSLGRTAIDIEAAAAALPA